MNYTPLFIFLFVLPVSYAKYENVTINESIDENLVRIREIISEAGFDPLKLPNISTTLYVTSFFFLNESVMLNLTNGVLSGGATMERLGDFYLTFHARTIRLHGRVHFDELKAKFNFSYDTTYYSDKGMLDATIKNVTVALNADFKLFEMRVDNPRIKLDYEDLSFTMTSNALFSPITNVIANVASSHYKSEVLKLSEGIAIDIAKQVIRKVNKNLPRWAVTVATSLLQDFLSGRLAQETYCERRFYTCIEQYFFAPCAKCPWIHT